MIRTLVICFLCTRGAPLFASATEEDPALVLDNAFTRSVGLFKNNTQPTDQEVLQALKRTFKAFAMRQDLGIQTTCDATLALGLMALFGGPGPRDFRKAWRHFETIQQHNGASLDVRNRAANFMVILITRGHVPEDTSPKGKILMLMSTHTIREDVKEHVRDFFAAHKAFAPSSSTASTHTQEDCSDWENSSGYSSTSASSASDEEDEGENDSAHSEEGEQTSEPAHASTSQEESQACEAPSHSCARTIPYTEGWAHGRQSNKRQRR